MMHTPFYQNISSKLIESKRVKTLTNYFLFNIILYLIGLTKAPNAIFYIVKAN